jgi:hypothetical protein
MRLAGRSGVPRGSTGRRIRVYGGEEERASCHSRHGRRLSTMKLFRRLPHGGGNATVVACRPRSDFSGFIGRRFSATPQFSALSVVY